MISNFEITYNGEKLTDYFDLTGEPEGRNIANRENVIQSFGNANGSLYVNGRFTEKVISLPVYGNNHDVNFLKNKINLMLNVDEPKPLVFSDRPNEIWYAIVDSDSSLIRSIDSTREIRGTINFLVPEGRAHSNVIKSSTATLDENGILSVTVDNQGTDSTELNVQAEFNSDNGVFATITPYQIIEVGSSEEMDGHDYQVTDVVAKNVLTPSDKGNWLVNDPSAKSAYPIALTGVANSVGTGSFSWPAGSESPTVTYSGRGDKKWAGPTLHRSFVGNSNGLRTGNFEAIWRFSHKNTKANQSGRQEFNLQNGDTVPFAMIMRDGTKSKIEAIAEFWLIPPGESRQITSVHLDLKKIKSNWWEIRFIRIGSQLTFRLSNIKKVTGDYGNEDVKESYYTVSKTFNMDWIKGLPIDSTTYWAQAGDLKTAPLEVHPTNFSFRWINVDKWADDPNRYTKGDVMYIDSSNTKTLLNGIPILNDVVKGSEYLKIPPGLSTIQFAYSSFATTPTVKVFWQEVFL